MPNGGTLTIETANVDLDEHYAAMHSAVDAGTLRRSHRHRLGHRHVARRAASTCSSRSSPRRRKAKARGSAWRPCTASRRGAAEASTSTVRSGEAHRSRCIFRRWPCGDGRRRAGGCRPVDAAGRETVLVVEDADGLRELTKRLLETQGYTVVAAANAEEALRLFDENPSIDVLLTDVVMPGPSGPELTKQLIDAAARAEGDLHVRLHRRSHRPARRAAAGNRVPAQTVQL